MADPICATFLHCAKDFQPLAAGILAVIGAGVTAFVVYRAASLPVKATEQRLRKEATQRVRLRRMEFSEELGTLAKRAKMAAATVKVHKASNKDVTDATRKKVMLEMPSAIQDWQFMSLIPDDVATRALQLAALVRDHNFDMERAGGAFGDDNFGNSIMQRLDSISNQALDFRGALSEAVHWPRQWE